MNLANLPNVLTVARIVAVPLVGNFFTVSNGIPPLTVGAVVSTV